ncbi:MAG: polymerase sporulation-specific sigma factor [Petroclostridium sp.]|jgi:RNA polymerase sporulation-specific sigma factor|uniref:sigma-70 family RNA polymerase sigma factor n=1 Tax=Petroclostridium xylanilyticum TaxID=1792311 RepID=UPI000B98B8F1|nr:sigma-70 family RNA polymerase sigma factor [Petroclostridium xylanilyticum]MBZ4646358.1 sigma-70 family polymerase sigma factor [Clostridia bacterium]MDK2811119.1 polymerase sporulation-specific sigma factor [Petroclostridium sp.]
MQYKLKELVQRTKKGDDQAAEQLLLKLKPLILSSIKKYASIGIDRDELLQEGYLEVLRLTYDYDESKGIPFLGYVKAYLNYFFMNYFRGMKIVYDSLDQDVSIGDDKVSKIDFIHDDSPTPLEQYVVQESYEELSAAIKQLTPKQREIIYLCYYSKMPMTAIARKMNMHYMSVVKLKQRAIQKLRNLLKREGR